MSIYQHQKWIGCWCVCVCSYEDFGHHLLRCSVQVCFRLKSYHSDALHQCHNRKTLNLLIFCHLAQGLNRSTPDTRHSPKTDGWHCSAIVTCASSVPCITDFIQFVRCKPWLKSKRMQFLLTVSLLPLIQGPGWHEFSQVSQIAKVEQMPAKQPFKIGITRNNGKPEQCTVCMCVASHLEEMKNRDEWTTSLLLLGLVLFSPHRAHIHIYASLPQHKSSHGVKKKHWQYIK